MRHLPLLLLLPFATACGNEQRGKNEDADLQRLLSRMTGQFSSETQAQGSDDYFDIRLAMVQIWTEREDGPWLYVEQAVAQAMERPYRQRVYRLRRVDADLFESRVYAFPDPPSHVGAWKKDKPLADLGPADLTEKKGCGVYLRLRADGAFAGGTLGTACANAFGGATYATSFVTVHADRLEAWDRGYDADHKPKWGPDAGPYVFRKTVDAPPKATTSER